jgi:hypothetical protein
MSNKPTFPEAKFCNLGKDCPLRGNNHSAATKREHLLYHTSAGLSTELTFKEYKKIALSRKDLLDPELIAYTDKQIHLGAPVPAQIITVSERDMGSYFSISMFGVLACGRKFQAKIWRVTRDL